MVKKLNAIGWCFMGLLSGGGLVSLDLFRFCFYGKARTAKKRRALVKNKSICEKSFLCLPISPDQ